MKIGYARVSTVNQNFEYQLEELKKAHCEKIYTDKHTGILMERPEFDKMLEMLRAGDELVVYSLDRFGRSMAGVMQLIFELNDRKVKLISLKEHLDTSTPLGLALVGILAAFAEIDYVNRREKQAAGIENAKKLGVKLGRKSKINSNHIKAVATLRSQGLPIRAIAQSVNLSRSAVHTIIKSLPDNP